MFKKVLLYAGSSIDGSLIAHADDFCDRAGAELTTLNIFEQPSSPVSDYFTSHHIDLHNIVIEGYESRLKQETVEQGIRTDIKREVRWGKDFVEAIRMVREGGYDLLISASQQDDGPPDGTAMHLMRKCPCPVWIHRGHLWKGAIRILVALNTSAPSEENRRLNRKILEHGSRLNDILRGHLHVITCWSGYMESMLSGPRFGEKEKNDYLQYEREKAGEELQTLLDSLGLTDKVKTKILHGNPDRLIPHYADEQKMDIVVIGSVARTGIPGMLVGNTAEKIVANLKDSILVIKPDDFISPVS
ncbi:hypothetical protein GM415_01835 [Pseudodesulfovibrio cashew]|uniref:UspA domain-containing protein n=1 Tax=Pseudodesulfovibrio cashew TaxID=2678688 RepID=A0A6I6JFX4_9BACT|nr:universal stress protein [Pseudodesulfovibrio cashew]QGY38927.1 hypothetical protein GM415_01835 [Pseudodesulfovibrio cashew]